MTGMTLCCTVGIDRMALLRELWHAACLSQGVGRCRWRRNRAIRDLHVNGYAERICGMSLKVQLFDGDLVDATNYNQMHGDGRFEQVVMRFRAA